MFITENKEILKRRRKKPKKKITNNIINQRDIQLLLPYWCIPLSLS